MLSLIPRWDVQTSETLNKTPENTLSKWKRRNLELEWSIGWKAEMSYSLHQRKTPFSTGIAIDWEIHVIFRIRNIHQHVLASMRFVFQLPDKWIPPWVLFPYNLHLALARCILPQRHSKWIHYIWEQSQQFLQICDFHPAPETSRGGGSKQTLVLKLIYWIFTEM